MKQKTKRIVFGIAAGTTIGIVLVPINVVFHIANLVLTPIVPIFGGICGYICAKDAGDHLQDTLVKGGIDICKLQDATRKDFQKWKISKVDESEVPEHIREFLKK